VAAQPRLDVTDPDALEEADERAEADGRRIALHEDRLRLLGLHDVPQPVETSVRDVVQRLSGRHDLEVVRGLEVEDVEDSVDEFVVLPGQNESRLDLRAAGHEGTHHGRHLDRLRPCADHDQDAGRGVAHGASPPPCRICRRRSAISPRNCATISARKPTPTRRTPMVVSRITR